MRQKRKKIIGCFFAAFTILFGNVFAVTAAERFEQIGNVTPSNIAYSVDLANANAISIMNEEKVNLTIGKRYYLVYTVEKVNDNNLVTSGFFAAKDQSQSTPYVTGMLKYSQEKEALLEESATYFCRVEATEEGFDFVIAKKGKKDSHWVDLPIEEEVNIVDCRYFGIYLYGTKALNAKLTSVICYDEKGNNLGVSVKTLVGTNAVEKISTAIDDYSLCEAVYWCEENQTTLILDAEQNIGVQEENSDKDTVWHQYNVRGTTLTMIKGKEEIAYDYYYSFMRDSDGHKYIRLGDTKVTFVTGQDEHKDNRTVTVTASDGYKIKRPDDPVVKGYTFKEWRLSNGSTFDFDKYVTESVTLYATYVDGDGHEYVAMNSDINHESAKKMWKDIILSVGIVFVTGVLIILIIRGGKKNATRKN